MLVVWYLLDEVCDQYLVCKSVHFLPTVKSTNKMNDVVPTQKYLRLKSVNNCIDIVLESNESVNICVVLEHVQTLAM